VEFKLLDYIWSIESYVGNNSHPSRPDFTKAFILDVDWSTHGVSAYYCRKKGGGSKSLFTLVSKSLSLIHKKIHLVEGECYVLVWGILHFWQCFYWNHFALCTNHKPLEWLATVWDAYGWKGRWINTLHDFKFKIIHIASFRHTNVDALNRNPMDVVDEWEDLIEEI
jgi:hypothetical protein